MVAGILVGVPLAAFCTFFSCFQCFIPVDNSDRGVVQTFGRFSRVVEPGLNFVAWPWQTLTAVSTKTRLIDCATDTKTGDSVSVKVRTVVVYAVDPKRVHEYLFKMTNAASQIEAHVDGIVRSEIPKYTVDEAYKVKDDIANVMKAELSNQLASFGLVIQSCTVVDLLPDSAFLTSMNAINAAKREREACFERAEGEKLLVLKQAEADAEARHIAGQGIAKQRQAVAAGFRDSVKELSELCGMDTKDALHATLVAQYLDVLREFAIHGRSSVVVPSGPGALSAIESQVRDGFLQARAMAPAGGSDVSPHPPPPPSAGNSLAPPAPSLR